MASIIQRVTTLAIPVAGTASPCPTSGRPRPARRRRPSAPAALPLLAAVLLLLAAGTLPRPAAAQSGPEPAPWRAAQAPAPGPADRGPDVAELERAGSGEARLPVRAPSKMPAPHPLQEQYDVLHYDLDLSIDPTRERLEGKVHVEAVVTSGPLQVMALDLLDPMVCRRAWLVDRALPAKTTHADGLLLVDLGGSVTMGDTIHVSVEFSGSPQPHGLFGFQFFETIEGTPAAASLSEPWSARSWWPCKDDPRDKATFTATLRVPQGMTGVSNGRLVSGPAPGAKARVPLSVFVWDEPLPISTYHFSVAVARYERLDDVYVSGTDTLSLQHYVYPSLVEPARYDFATLPQMLAFCEERFGPYPFPGQKHGLALFDWDGAMEHPTATTWSSIFVTGDRYFNRVLLHELAHYWFGDLVTCEDWTHVWLQEGFATYAEGLWEEYTRGPAYLRYFMSARSVFTWWKGPLVRSPDSDDAWYYFHNMVYHKGAWVLHMLRRQVGDEAFMAILRGFLDHPDFRYGTATTDDFLDICASVLGYPMHWFLDQWLYWQVQPELRVTWRNLDAGPLEVRVEQLQPDDPVYGHTAFLIPIELRLQGAGLDTLATIWVGRRDQIVQLRPGRVVSTVTVDPYCWLLHKLVSASQEPAAAGPAVRLLPASPNPFNPRCVIGWRTEEPTRDRLEIYDLRGRRILARSWDERPAGLRRWTWEGRDEADRACPAGTYLYRVTCAVGAGTPATVQGKLTLAR